MEPSSTRKSFFIILSVVTSIVIITFLISIFARGYRLDTANNQFTIKATGILSVTSKPRLANIYVNELLKGTSDNTINLNPGSYHVKITKDGFYSWEKNIQIQKEIVSPVDAQLFRISPELKNITQNGIINPRVSPDGNKIIYAIASSSADNKESGLYILEINEFSILLGRYNPRFLSPNLPSIDWSKYTYEFSPNSHQIIAHSTIKNSNSTYLFSLDQSLTSKNITDISSKSSIVKESWQSDLQQIVEAKLEKVPLPLTRLIATSSATLSLNSTNDKILYQANNNGILDENIITPLPLKTNTQTQSRSLIKNNYYVYDLKEDANFLIGDTSISNLSWIPNSNNLIFTQDKNIRVCDYDSTNYQTIYTGYTPIKNILTALDGYKIIISHAVNSKSLPNLYSLTIRER